MGFREKVKSFGPAFNRKSEGFQIDLLFLRSDKTITICEMKYYNKEIGVKIIKEIETKIKSLTVPRAYTLEKALVSIYGQDSALEELDYFHHSLELNDFFGG